MPRKKSQPKQTELDSDLKPTPVDEVEEHTTTETVMVPAAPDITVQRPSPRGLIGENHREPEVTEVEVTTKSGDSVTFTIVNN